MRIPKHSRWGLWGLALALAACQTPVTEPGTPYAPATPQHAYRVLAAADTPATVVVFGGSEVSAGGAAGWPVQLAGVLPGATVVRLGREGATVAQVRDELLEAALATHPHVGIVALGGQDILNGTTQANFKAALNTIGYRFRMAGVPLYIVDIPRLDRYPAFADRDLKTHVGNLHDALKCVVRDQDANFIRLSDWTQALRERPGLVEADGVTPTAEGQAMLAKWIGEKVELPESETPSKAPTSRFSRN